MDGQTGRSEIDCAIFEQAFRKLLQGAVTHPVATKCLDLAEAEIAELERLRERLHEYSDQQLDFAVRNARARLANRQFFANYDYKLVSVGTDCLSRTIPTRWGLKPPKSLGERTHPFDLAVHPYEAVCEVLDRDFEEYLDVKWLGMNNLNYVIHKKLKVHFNHEKGENFSANEYSYFIEQYRRRINNLREDIANHPILYVLHITASRVPCQLYEILARGTPRGFALLAISTADDPFEEATAADAPPGMILEHIPYPYAGYVWHIPAHYASPAGQAFDRRIVAAVRRTIVGEVPLASSGTGILGTAGGSRRGVIAALLGSRTVLVSGLLAAAWRSLYRTLYSETSVGSGAMLRSIRRIAAGLGIGLLAVIGSGGTPASAADLLVLAAASLKNAFDAVGAEWQAQTGKTVTFSYAASSALAKQIEQGAPADIFVSADLDWMDYLADARPDQGRDAQQPARQHPGADRAGR